MLAFDIVEFEPSVERLEVNFEDQHMLFFQEDEEQSAANRK